MIIMKRIKHLQIYSEGGPSLSVQIWILTGRDWLHGDKGHNGYLGGAHEAGLFGDQARVPAGDQQPADDETQDGQQRISLSPGIPPVPSPGDDERQEGNEDHEEQHLEDDAQGKKILSIFYVFPCP